MAEDPRTPPPATAGADPSMEDILASIRRILNEDEPGAAPGPAPNPDPNEPLALTEAMLVGEPAKPAAAPAPPPPPPPQPVVSPVVVAPPPPPAPPPAPIVAEPPSQSLDALMAPAAAAAASAAMGQLMRAVSQDRGAALHRSGGPSIEDVVREELRPLLKQWLDQNLPPMVERLVRAEIERVVGRALS
jgi:cell pole-organizing protein PopZ